MIHNQKRNGYFMDIDLMSRIKIIIHIFAPPYIIYRTYSNACSTTEKYITPILLQQRNNTSQLYKQQLYTPIFHNKWWPCSKSLQKPWRNSFDSVSPTHVVENATKTLKKFDIDSVTLDVTLWYRFCHLRYHIVEDIEQSGDSFDYRAQWRKLPSLSKTIDHNVSKRGKNHQEIHHLTHSFFGSCIKTH